MGLQRLADALVGNDYGRQGLCHGLRQGHIGAICDALAAAGIDPAVWTAKDIQAVLEADMRATGGTWPDQITNPGGFLAHRLRRLAASFIGSPARPPVSPPPPVTTAAADTDSAAARAASAEHRAAMRAQFAADLRSRRRTGAVRVSVGSG